MFFRVHTLALALSTVLPAAMAASGFLATRTGPSLSGSTLSANCINEGGGSQKTSLDLNNGCVINNNGGLFCGGYVYAFEEYTT